MREALSCTSPIETTYYAGIKVSVVIFDIMFYSHLPCHFMQTIDVQISLRLMCINFEHFINL